MNAKSTTLDLDLAEYTQLLLILAIAELDALEELPL